MTCGLYCITNKVNNKRYIGSSVNVEQRWREHKSQLNRHVHLNRHLQNAWLKYGKNAFVFSVLIQCEQKELLDFEQKYLDETNPEYNKARYAKSPFSGRKHSEATLRKMSGASKGNKYANGRKWTLTERERMSLRLTGNTFRKGKVASLETRQKMSDAHKGLAGHWTGKKLSNETRRKMSESHKRGKNGA
jgi:group I intron endonuclease